MRTDARLYLNGRPLTVSGGDLLKPLSDFLRDDAACRGVKIACGEGACGVCTVLVGRPAAGGNLAYRTAYSCLHPVFQMDGAQVVTVEGLTPAGGLSPVQSAMVAGHGTQCGFCTPGFVVAMTALFDKPAGDAAPDAPAIRSALSGNLCRCTGYLPIVQSALAVDGESARGTIHRAYPPAPIAAELAKQTIEGLQVEIVRTHAATLLLLQPTTWADAVRLRDAHPGSVVAAGGTGFCGAANVSADSGVLLSLTALLDSEAVTAEGGRLRIPATATWQAVGAVVAGVFPALAGVVDRYGSPQLRAVATIGGSVAHAEGNADILPLLLVLEAEVLLESIAGERIVPIAEFLHERCPADALLKAVLLPLPPDSPRHHMRAYKIRRRQAYDRSVFCAAVSVTCDDSGGIVKARLVVGGVGPVPHRLPATEDFLASGRRMDRETMLRAGQIAAGEVEPVDDSYAGAAYRRQLVSRLPLRFLLDIGGEDAA